MTTRSLLQVALTCAALAAAGCGDDDARTPAPAAPTTTATIEPPARTAAPDAAEPLACEPVTFTPRSDHGAFEIRASGVDCETAREVAAAAERNVSGGNGSDPLQPEVFQVEGFECSGRVDETAELPSVEWACVRGKAEVTFSTS